MIKIQEIKLNDILPGLLKNDKTMAAISKVLQKYLDENYEYIKRLNILPNIDNLENEELVDHLAYQFHVDFYDPSLSLDKKRRLVKDSIAHHRKRGTPAAIEDLVATLFGSGEVEEWFEYGGEPYHFKVIVDVSALGNKLESFHRALATVKNTRSHLEEFIGSLGKIIIQLKLKTYTFDVPYKICNLFQTADIFGGLMKVSLGIEEKFYVFDVLYPICNTFVTSKIIVENESINVVLTEEYRDNEILFRRTGNTTLGEGDI